VEDYFPWLCSHPLLCKPYLCKPSYSVPRISVWCLLLRLAKFYLLKFPVSQRSSSWQSHTSQLLQSDPSEGNPGWVLQGSCKLQPGLTQAVYQYPQLLIHCLLGSWARTPGPPLPTVQNSQREQWEFLISIALFPRRGIKCALTKFTLPHFFSWGLRWIRNKT
jgi:hypothetical protein